MTSIQSVNAAEVELHLWAQLRDLETRGIVQITQDEVLVLDAAAFRAATGWDPL